MDKLYSNRALVTKACCCILLPFVHIVVVSALSVDSLLSFLYSNILIGCLYTIPFWMTLIRLNRYGADRIRRYVILDFVSCYVPVIASSIIYETIAGLLDPSPFTGVFTLLLIIILMLISGAFWFLYRCIGKHNRP